MPKNDVNNYVRAGVKEGYVRLAQGGKLEIGGTDDDQQKRLRDVLGANKDGHVTLKDIVEQQKQEAKDEAEARTAQMLARQRQARREAAKAQLQTAWTRMGGPSSPVGLPLGGDIVVKETGPSTSPTFSADFRGGSIHLSNDGDVGSTDNQKKVYINLVGIECQVRQEGTDEIYAVVSVLGPSSHSIASTRIPSSGTISMGPDGMRISTPVTPLLADGVIQNYYVWVSMVENDSGDVDVIARDISNKFADAVSTGLQGLTGMPAEAVGDSESFKENIATGLAWVFGNVLGMGDDPYDAESFPLFWADLNEKALPLQPPYSRSDDPRTITSWTHRVIVSGVDDGGDHGQYAFYFRVWVEDHPKTYSVPTK